MTAWKRTTTNLSHHKDVKKHSSPASSTRSRLCCLFARFFGGRGPHKVSRSQTSFLMRLQSSLTPERSGFRSGISMSVHTASPYRSHSNLTSEWSSSRCGIANFFRPYTIILQKLAFISDVKLAFKSDVKTNPPDWCPFGLTRQCDSLWRRRTNNYRTKCAVFLSVTPNNHNNVTRT